MESFEDVLEQYAPMISAVMRKANIYKNKDYFRQCARIALWQAWKNYDATLGSFAPYAYRTMLTTMYKEIHRDNRHTERFTAVDKDILNHFAQYQQLKNEWHQDFPQLDNLLSQLTTAEHQLLIDLYVHQLSYAELSERDGVSIYALQKRRNRLLKRLREQLAGT